MPYGKLSDLVAQVSDPQQTDKFVKLFKAAVRDGRLTAMTVPQTFTLPKRFTRRGLSEPYEKTAHEMVYLNNSEAVAWFNETIEQLERSERRKAKVKPSFEAIEAGEIDFAAYAAETRRKLNESFSRGKRLGKNKKK